MVQRELLGVEVEAQWVEGELRPLAGLPGDGEPALDRRNEAFAAWRRFFEALAERHPLVLVFEDLHWADDGLLDFIDALVEWIGGVPLLVLATARPELLELVALSGRVVRQTRPRFRSHRYPTRRQCGF